MSIQLIARGDNGYRCSCCGQSWEIKRRYDTEEALITDCLDDMRSAEEFGDGFEIKDINLIEHSDGCTIIRSHPRETEIIRLINERYALEKQLKKAEEEREERKEKLANFKAELADIDNRKKFLQDQIDELTVCECCSDVGHCLHPQSCNLTDDFQTKGE